MRDFRKAVQRCVIAVGIVALSVLVPIPSPVAGAPLPPDSPAPVAADAHALSDPAVTSTIASLPPDFAAVMGYEPVSVDSDGHALLIKPTGDCSSPLGATSYDFALACAQHDLGYDLLRYATASGSPLGPWARRAIDQDFATTARAHCASTSSGINRLRCVLTADVYAGVVRLNSWRQGNGNPGHEPVTRLVLLTAGLLWVGGLSVGWRRSR